jgi:hypothetical protein
VESGLFRQHGGAAAMQQEQMFLQSLDLPPN